MKQLGMFGGEFEKKIDSSYTSKIKTPDYEPRAKQPHIALLLNESKTKRIINEINQSGVSEEEKEFLRKAAARHSVFNYEQIADYFAHASPEMQKLMARQALVVIDFKDAYRYGYLKLSRDIANIYLNIYENE